MTGGCSDQRTLHHVVWSMAHINHWDISMCCQVPFLLSLELPEDVVDFLFVVAFVVAPFVVAAPPWKLCDWYCTPSSWTNASWAFSFFHSSSFSWAEPGMLPCNYFAWFFRCQSLAKCSPSLHWPPLGPLPANLHMFSWILCYIAALQDWLQYLFLVENCTVPLGPYSIPHGGGTHWHSVCSTFHSQQEVVHLQVYQRVVELLQPLLGEGFFDRLVIFLLLCHVSLVATPWLRTFGAVFMLWLLNRTAVVFQYGLCCLSHWFSISLVISDGSPIKILHGINSFMCEAPFSWKSLSIT